MSINKRKFRKFADPGFRFDRGNGLFRTKAIKYIVRTAIKNIAGQRVLLLYVYEGQQIADGSFRPRWTVFQSRSDYATLAVRKDGSTAWQTSIFENLERECGFENRCAFYSLSDEKRITRFCRHASLTGFSALDDLQWKLKAQKELARRHTKQQKIIACMKDLSPLPRDLKGWIHREILPQYLFYEYHKGKAPMKGYCTACRHEVEVTGAKHNQKGICPRCKKEVLFKSRGRLGYLSDRATVQVIQKIGTEELIIRILKVYCNYRKKDVPQLDVYENTRVFIRRDAQGKCVSEPYHTSYDSGDLTPWKNGYCPVMYLYQENFRADVCGHLYCRSIDTELMGTPWQYCQVKEFYLNDCSPMEVEPYLHTYLESPMLEYLVKLRLFWLARHEVYGGRNGYGQHEVLKMDGKTLQEVLGVEKSDIPFLQQAEVGVRELRLLQIMRAQRMQPEAAMFRWIREHDISSVEDFLLPLRHTTPHKLMQYLETQYEALKEKKSNYGAERYRDLRSVLTEYKDYLNNGEALAYDVEDGFVLFPRDLSAAHDQSSMLMDCKKVEQYDAQIAGIYKKLAKRYQYQKDGLVVLPPKTAQEIVVEGQTLHHCVGGYVVNVVEGRCAILFIRQKEHPDQPFITVEIRGDEIVQARGSGNGIPPTKVNQFLEQWAKRKLLKAKAA